MSIQQLKQEADALCDEERRELIAYLIAKGQSHSPAYWDALSGKIEKNNQARWVREEELDRTLGLESEATPRMLGALEGKATCSFEANFEMTEEDLLGS